MSPSSKRHRANKDRDRAEALWSAGGSSLSMVREGIIVAAIPALFGLLPLLTGHIQYHTRAGMVTIDGAPARVLGLAAIALGFCVHVHFYWEPHKALSKHARPAMFASALVLVASLAYAFYALVLHPEGLL
jgi:hypothetical protein